MAITIKPRTLYVSWRMHRNHRGGFPCWVCPTCTSTGRCPGTPS